MINYITNGLKKKLNMKSPQHNSDQNHSQTNNPNSSTSKISPNHENKDKQIKKKNNENNPSKLLWVYKVNFDIQNDEKNNEGLKRNKSIGNFEKILIEETQSMKHNNFKSNKIETPINPAITPQSSKRQISLKELVNPEIYNSKKGNKTSHDKYRKRNNQVENYFGDNRKDQEMIRKNENESNQIQTRSKIKFNNNIEKKVIVGDINTIKSSNLAKSSQFDQNCLTILEEEIKINSGGRLNESSENISEKTKKNKKHKKKKRKNKNFNAVMEPDFLMRIKQNLVSLFEKQKLKNNNKKILELPKIDFRVPEQKKEKISSPKMNINVNNNNNSNSPSFNITTLKPNVKIEINQNFFKKPFEYISSYEYIGDNSNYNSYIYNKNYLKYVDKIAKVFQKENLILFQSPQIQLPIYSYANFVRSDYYILMKVMKHRVNWNSTVSNKFYNFRWNYSTKGLEYSKLVSSPDIIDRQKFVNHFEYHTEITDKRRLFINLLKFCDLTDFDLFKIIPFTIIISYRKDSFDNNIKSFTDLFNTMNDIKRKKNHFTINSRGLNGISTNLETIFNKNYTDLFDLAEREKFNSNKVTMSISNSFFSESNMWIIKPSDLCQGNCMKISNDLNKIIKKVRKFFSGIDQTFKDSDDDEEQQKKQIEKINLINNLPNDEKSKPKEKMNRYYSSTVILQKYLEKPLLYMNRKFDIRVWVLIDSELNVYIFKEGHLKCSSEIYDMNNKNQFIHITNYSVQKHSNNFEKYEFGNEVSFSDFQKQLDTMSIKLDIQKDIMFKLKKIIEITAFSANKKLNKKNAKYCLEILGYDFIIDSNFDVWLLEVNDNPGLCESSPLIKILVPRMLDDAFRLTIDKVFQTKYSDGILDAGVYKSPFHIENYSDEENMFEFICNVNVDEEEYCKNIKMNKLICSDKFNN